jgi:cytochrome b
MPRTDTIKVWDPLVRLFHWALVAAFTIAFITEDDFLTLHTWAGYTVLGLLLVRMLWGLIGPRYARFSDFVRSPATVLGYLKDLLRLKAKRYIGHNPAGGAMIVLLLISLVLTTITGLAVYGAGENAGLLAGWLGQAGEFWAKIFEEVHEFFANFTLLLVVIHVAGVLFESLLHRENLIKAMLNGYKRVTSKQETVS